VQSGIEQDRIGEVIDGKWTLERLIGVGGMAAVYAARHQVGTTVAIKILHPQFARLTELRQRFEREARVMGQLDHPGAVEVRDIDVTADGSPYIVMELLEGRPLSRSMREGNGLSVPEMLTYADQTLSVLAAAHQQGIVHRDIKPDNLFVTHQGQLKVLDFGIARMLENHVGPGQAMTAAGTRLGTLPYMPPEQVIGADIDGRADLFSLGAVMYKALAGRRVHACSSEAELLVKMAKHPAPPLCEVAPQLPPSVGQVVDCALAVRREERYPDAPSMQADVQSLLHGRRPLLVRTPSRASLSAVDTAALMRVRKEDAGAPPSATHPTVVPGASPTAPTAPGVSATGPTVVPDAAGEATRIEGAISRSQPPPAPRSSKQTTDPMHEAPSLSRLGTLTSASSSEPPARHEPIASAQSHREPMMPNPQSPAAPPEKKRSRVGGIIAISMTVGVLGVLGVWALVDPESDAAEPSRTSGRKTSGDDDDDRRYAPVDLDDEPPSPGASTSGEPTPPQPKAEPEPPPKEPKEREKERKKRERELEKQRKKRRKREKKKR